MSILQIAVEEKNGRTVITDCVFTAPLKIVTPFYRPGETEIMMMAASPGLLDGDDYEIALTVGSNASLRFSGQSYTKLFKSDLAGSSQSVRITVEDNGRLIYKPCPVIPFAGSIYTCNTEVHLSANSKFAMTDVFAVGRVAMNEQFKFKKYHSCTKVYVDGKLKFFDQQRLIPLEWDLASLGFFEGYTHCGILYLFGQTEIILPDYENVESAITKAAAGYCIRAFANSADCLCKLFDDILKLSNF